MEKSKEEPHIIDYDSDSDEFSDAIDTHADFKAEDDFFDVPEWREEKAKNEDGKSANRLSSGAIAHPLFEPKLSKFQILRTHFLGTH